LLCGCVADAIHASIHKVSGDYVDYRHKTSQRHANGKIPDSILANGHRQRSAREALEQLGAIESTLHLCAFANQMHFWALLHCRKYGSVESVTDLAIALPVVGHLRRLIAT
jgi:hypothetical protein